jgi:hypothetical protein
MWSLNNINNDEIINVINDYIKNNYQYNYADILDDTIIYHLEDDSVVNIYINVESESE